MLHLAALFAFFLHPQDPTPATPPRAADLTIDAAVRAEVIDTTLRLLADEYVFPEVGKAMAEAVRKHAADRAYDSLASARAFAERLTTDLQAVSKDKHLRVRFCEQPLPPEPPRDPAAEARGPSAEEVEQLRREAARDNFAFRRVERLDGNVGYLDFRLFLPSAIAGERMAAAMHFVSDCDALVFDLRKNGGGSPEMVAFACSYLFGVQPVHLNDIYERTTGLLRQSWTTPGVPGRKFLGDVYVLTSNYTFSGAEEFAYDLQVQKRATIVGEVSGGGANPGGMHRAHAHFTVFVPSARAINPVTGTNWEGTGVLPDVRTSAELALAKAHALALEKLLPGTADPDLRAERESALARLRQEIAKGEEKR